MEDLNYVFQPINIKSLNLKNRIIMPAMHLGYCENGFVTDKLINFYSERAKGGAGLIIVGGCKVDKFSGGTPTFIFIDDDKYIEGLKKLTDAVHSNGAKISCQLYHAGRYAHSFLVGETPISASAVRSKFTGETPREMTKQEIKQTIENIAKAAQRAKKAGFDAIELLGSAGYLINQFLSPLTNKRTDEYGGSFENRCRFPFELISEIRKTVGEDFVIGIRMSGDDFMEGSNTIIENKEIAKLYEKAGIDLINVTGGWHETKVPQISSYVPQGSFVYLAQQIKSVVNIPVVACNRINNIFLAEKILFETNIDLIGMARALIADPYLIIKAKEKKYHHIKPCIACNQGCFDKVFEIQPTSCLVNPQAGKEQERKIIKTNSPKNIVIIGAGPAGCEAARVLSLCGHSVTIMEKEDKIGGQVNLACAIPGKQNFASIIDYYENQIKELNITLELNKDITCDELLKLSPDIIIFATGSIPIKPDIKGINNKNVVFAQDVLNKKNKVGKNVVIIGGGSVGCETACFLLNNEILDGEKALFLLKYNAITLENLLKFIKTDRKITIVEVLDKVGRDIGRSTRWTIMAELKQGDVNILTRAKVLEIKDNEVEVEIEDKKINIPCDTVIIAVGSKANDILYQECKDKFKNVYKIGDCAKPRKIIDAIAEGFDIAKEI